MMKHKEIIEAAQKAKDSGSLRFCMGSAWREMGNKKKAGGRGGPRTSVSRGKWGGGWAVGWKCLTYRHSVGEDLTDHGAGSSRVRDVEGVPTA
ncbi:hypothetical protein TrLO_g10338 [Triparma laevis f. longispina]|uniref:Uncharacterized protein n=1 Tax=Triparma laevis f. longispina TaxID=1714387 RepID=A0A9W6Z7A8_9STRA|nr:hypothetical protein TrLO_g10338 [Triparma laevis f. longispina]